MDSPPPSPRQNPGSVRPGLILAVTTLGALAGSFFWWPKWQAKLHPPNRATPGRATSSVSAPPNDPVQQIREQTAYWGEHKDRLRQLLTVDYPAALARRDAKFPEVAAVVKFGEEYANNFERQNHEVYLRAEDQDKKFRAKLIEMRAQHRGGVWGDFLLAERWLADTEPVPGGATISGLARQFWTDDPNSLDMLRRMVANTERRNFSDEATARRVEALQTPQEVVDYVLASRIRWETEQKQAYTEAGYDADVGEYMMGSQTAAMVSTLTKDYERRSHVELDAVNRESDAILGAMHEPELAEASRDDPESRRLLTELKDFLLLREQQRKEGLMVAK